MISNGSNSQKKTTVGSFVSFLKSVNNVNKKTRNTAPRKINLNFIFYFSYYTNIVSKMSLKPTE